MESQEVSSQDVEENISLVHADQVKDESRTVTQPFGRSVDWSVAVEIGWLMRMSCRSRERVTGSWRDGLVITLWISGGLRFCGDSRVVFLLQSSGGSWGAGG